MKPPDASAQKWANLVANCLARRHSVNVFMDGALYLCRHDALAGEHMAEALLRPRAAGACAVDPRAMLYLEHLLDARELSVDAVLNAALRWSRHRPPELLAHGDENEAACNEAHSRWRNPVELDEMVLRRVYTDFAVHGTPHSRNEARKSLAAVSRWMDAMVASQAELSVVPAMQGVNLQKQEWTDSLKIREALQILNARENLGMLVFTVLENAEMIEVLNLPSAKGR